VFIDTSVVVAILAKAADAADLVAKISDAKYLTTSGLVRLEAVMRLSTMLDIPPADADIAFDRLIQTARIAVIPITDDIAKLSVAAFERYGKGRGHSARLNLADCLSYAAAKSRRERLLFKGDDFGRTDVNDDIEN